MVVASLHQNLLLLPPLLLQHPALLLPLLFQLFSSLQWVYPVYNRSNISLFVQKLKMILTALVISQLSVHICMCFLAFSHQCYLSKSQTTLSLVDRKKKRTKQKQDVFIKQECPRNSHFLRNVTFKFDLDLCR